MDSTKSTAAAAEPRMTSALVADPNIGYKLRVLLHDFRNVSKDPAAQRRISTTTDPLYISGPYFTPHEAASVKGAIVGTWKPTHEPVSYEESDFEMDTGDDEPKTVQGMIEGCMARFFEKRKASGDSRPCGPHDMAPLYEAGGWAGRSLGRSLGRRGFCGG